MTKWKLTLRLRSSSEYSATAILFALFFLVLLLLFNSYTPTLFQIIFFRFTLWRGASALYLLSDTRHFIFNCWRGIVLGGGVCYLSGPVLAFEQFWILDLFTRLIFKLVHTLLFKLRRLHQSVGLAGVWVDWNTQGVHIEIPFIRLKNKRELLFCVRRPWFKVWQSAKFGALRSMGLLVSYLVIAQGLDLAKRIRKFWLLWLCVAVGGLLWDDMQTSDRQVHLLIFEVGRLKKRFKLEGIFVILSHCRYLHLELVTLLNRYYLLVASNCHLKRHVAVVPF